jgi:hypothetical protein
VTLGRNRTSFKWRQLGAIAITVAFKTCRVTIEIELKPAPKEENG